MGSVNQSFLPATPGLNIGSPTQKWDLFVRNLTTDNLLSSTAGTATSGILRLATTDTINWRNAANTGDIALGKSQAAVGNLPADLLTFSGGGYQGKFISDTADPAASGILRLAKSDSIMFRNDVNGGDVIGIKHNSDDTISVGDAAGVMSTSYVSDTANPAASGQLRLANGDMINWRNAANNADYGLSADGSDRLVDSAINGLMLTGTSPNIRMGGFSATFPMLKRNLTAVNFRLADDSADAPVTASSLSLTGPVAKVNNILTVGQGVAGIVAKVDLVAQNTALVTTHLLNALGLAPGGMYRLSWYAKITTVAGVSSTLGPLTVTYTDPDSVTTAITAGALIPAGTVATFSTANTTATILMGVPLILNLKGSTDLDYAFQYASNAATVMNYNLHITLEYLA